MGDANCVRPRKHAKGGARELVNTVVYTVILNINNVIGVKE